MGMAFKSPGNQRLLRYVSHHAVDRMRQRTRVGVQLQDSQLEHLIDDAVEMALQMGDLHWRLVSERNKGATMVDITDTLDHTLLAGEVCALLKPDEKCSTREAVVTVLPRSVAMQIVNEGLTYEEAMKNEEPFNPAFAGLRYVQLPVQSEVKKEKPMNKQEAFPRFAVLGLRQETVFVGTMPEALEYIELSGKHEQFTIFKECRLKIRIEVEE